MDNFNDSHNPVPVIIALLSGIAKSDKIIEIIQQSGISIDLTLDPKDNFSNMTRIRAYLPRVEDIFRKSNTQDALHALTVTSGTMIQHYPEMEQKICDKLRAIGWEYSEGNILPASSVVSELYFTKDLEHTAYIEIRQIITSAMNSITIIDQWVNNTLFEYLKMLKNGGNYKISVITNKKCIDSLAFEANLFSKQYTDIQVKMYESKEFHDRFIIIDNKKLFHLGASIKDTGNKISIISKIEKHQIIDDVIKKTKIICDGN